MCAKIDPFEMLSTPTKGDLQINKAWPVVQFVDRIVALSSLFHHLQSRPELININGHVKNAHYPLFAKEDSQTGN